MKGILSNNGIIHKNIIRVNLIKLSQLSNVIFFKHIQPQKVKGRIQPFNLGRNTKIKGSNGRNINKTIRKLNKVVDSGLHK